MKEISMYVSGQQNSKNKHGIFNALLQFNENKRYFKGIIPNSSARESVSRGVLTALEKLKEPCNVNVFVSVNIRQSASGYMEQIVSTAEEKGCRLTINVLKGKEAKTVKQTAIRPTVKEEKNSKKQLSLNFNE